MVPVRVHWLLFWREEKNYEVTGGVVEFHGKNLWTFPGRHGRGKVLFLAFQYPVEIPGVSTTNFLKTALNEIRKYRGAEALDAVIFLN